MKKTTRGMWYILYRKQSEKSFTRLDGNKSYWYADPMVFCFKNKAYLFMEAFYMPLQIGYIAVSEFKEGFFSAPKVIIKSHYHLSYPCVFEYRNSVYMIPETSQNRTLELWVSKGDMYSWKKKGNLLEGIYLADNTIHIMDEKIFCFSYEEGNSNRTHIYLIDLERCSAKEIECIDHIENNKRPGGNFFYKGEKLFRPVQNNLKCYGESLIIYEIKSIVPFIEEYSYEIKPSSLCDKNHKYIKTHTLYSDKCFQVVDVFEEVDIPIICRLFVIRRIRNVYYRFVKRHNRSKGR